MHKIVQGRKVKLQHRSSKIEMPELYNNEARQDDKIISDGINQSASEGRGLVMEQN